MTIRTNPSASQDAPPRARRLRPGRRGLRAFLSDARRRWKARVEPSRQWRGSVRDWGMRTGEHAGRCFRVLMRERVIRPRRRRHWRLDGRSGFEPVAKVRKADEHGCYVDPQELIRSPAVVRMAERLTAQPGSADRP